MKCNLVITIFKVESEAFQAFSELSGNPAGKDYSAPEAALIKKNQDGGLDTLEVYGEAPTDKAAVGAVIGSLVGLLGGPIGVLVGAAIGGVAGGFANTADFIDGTSIIAVVASKIYEGEVAIAALVEEEEPAFDAAFEKYETTIVRYDAEAIAAEVKEFKENGTDKIEQVIKEAVAAAEVTEEQQQPAVKEELTGWRSATNRVLEY